MTVKLTAPYTHAEFSGSQRYPVRVNLTRDLVSGTYTISTSNRSTNCTVLINSTSVRASEIVSPSSFQIVIDEISTKEVPITIRVDGQPTEGYMYDDPEADQDSVMVTGPKTIVDQIRKAVAVVPAADSNGLTRTTSVLASFSFLDENNNALDQTYLTCEPNDYSVTIPVYTVARLPLTVNLISSDTVDKNSVQATIDPEEISVYGEEEIISQLTEINLGELQLGTVMLNADSPVTMPIQLPNGVSRMQGEPASAKVTIQAVGMSTREIRLPIFPYRIVVPIPT